MYSISLPFGVQLPETDIRERFEEHLVAIMVRCCFLALCNEYFSFKLIMSQLIDFSAALGDPARISTVCEHLLKAIAIIE